MAFYAFVGVYLAIVAWERTFTPAFRSYDFLNPDPDALEIYRMYVNLEYTIFAIIMLSTIICLFVCYLKH